MSAPLELDPAAWPGPVGAGDLPGTEAVRLAEEEALSSRNRLGPVFWIASAWIGLVTGAAALASVLPLPSPTTVGVTDPGAGPSLHHLLGGDDIGRDELARIVYGARVSLIVGFAAVGIGVAIALVIGMVAGYQGGWLDRIVCFACDTLLAFPGLVLALAIVAFVGPNLVVITAALALGALAPAIRVIRGTTIRWARQDFVHASHLLGATTPRILARDILPNVVPVAVSYGLVAVSFVMALEAALSYFGVSVRPPAASWGNMINEGTGVMGPHPQLVLWPSLVLFLTILALNLIADQVQAFFNVREAQL